MMNYSITPQNVLLSCGIWVDFLFVFFVKLIKNEQNLFETEEKYIDIFFTL